MRPPETTSATATPTTLTTIRMTTTTTTTTTTGKDPTAVQQQLFLLLPTTYTFPTTIHDNESSRTDFNAGISSSKRWVSTTKPTFVPTLRGTIAPTKCHESARHSTMAAWQLKVASVLVSRSAKLLPVTTLDPGRNVMECLHGHYGGP